MLNYWPNQISIDLNNAIVELFYETEYKLSNNLFNNTAYYLYTDVLNQTNKNKLLIIILKDLKRLILNLIELNLDKSNLKTLYKQIIQIFIEKVLLNFLSSINYKYSKELFFKIRYKYQDDILNKALFIYIIFGASSIEKHIFLFNSRYTPYKHVQVLLENFIIQTSNIVIQLILQNIQTSSKINYFLSKTLICNKRYSSHKSFTVFINNLKIQDFINHYIYRPQLIYYEQEEIFLISLTGIITKNISITRLNEIQKFDLIQLILIFWLELRDIVIPKSEIALIQFAKYIIFFLIHLINNIILILIRVIILYLNK
uniref:Uncharacterized protein n=1 Tax=Lophocladia kuetzingii TaxID=675577 RepID=A0A1Z1MNC6_9FLOR|nr:hypothetical protein [Lophocladia kuetzingii]ARW67558.1 hypothetical protein [Lophocladia kuetzingii]